MSRRWASAFAFLLCVTAAGRASAWCRTTTVKAPADYDASSEGRCFEGTDKKTGKPGLPLFWRNACVGYSIQADASRKVAYDVAADALSTAFTRWTGATCPTFGDGRSRTSIDVRDLGPVECENVEYVPRTKNQNVIIFRDNSWPYPPTVLGLTSVVYSPSTGEIFGADMEINTFQMNPLALQDPVARDAYDFASVVTHEAGHFLGMAHSEVPGATMFARYSNGQTSMRNLSSDDILGICEVYRPDGERSVLVEKVFKSPQCDPTPRGGFASTCQEAPSGLVCAGRTSPAPPAKGTAWALVALAGVAAVRRRLRKRAASASR